MYKVLPSSFKIDFLGATSQTGHSSSFKASEESAGELYIYNISYQKIKDVGKIPARNMISNAQAYVQS